MLRRPGTLQPHRFRPLLIPSGERPTGSTMVPAQAHSTVHELVDTLWFERRLLEFLLFKLVSANLVLSADDWRFVAPAIAEVERVVQEVRQAEADRAGLLSEVASEWNVGPHQLTLAYLAEHAPPELKSDLEDHRDAFMQLVNEIEELTRENRRLATVGIDGIRETLGLSQTVTYDAAGRRGQRPASATRFDRVL